jgi:hypothetical protein
MRRCAAFPTYRSSRARELRLPDAMRNIIPRFNGIHTMALSSIFGIEEITQPTN